MPPPSHILLIFDGWTLSEYLKYQFLHGRKHKDQPVKWLLGKQSLFVARMVQGAEHAVRHNAGF
jgi:hypothetical protein